ncbi:unnamed protein product [Sphenostylis stenocarpa]|uniref:Uncharacterized protein n=1 Tax=Sphenostylis stenocarpa TaxID=92480 RepID=A0AA86SS82_9FABA|nr:unnamed protein product [Sphenostylis stenocarpa]
MIVGCKNANPITEKNLLVAIVTENQKLAVKTSKLIFLNHEQRNCAPPLWSTVESPRSSSFNGSHQHHRVVNGGGLKQVTAEIFPAAQTVVHGSKKTKNVLYCREGPP